MDILSVAFITHAACIDIFFVFVFKVTLICFYFLVNDCYSCFVHLYFEDFVL
uniref:Uncharacterized protein n=1 Tax=Anguilla anguilla TaxID=7936 RepID=A0A0E9WA79_ANGAN